MPPPPPPPEGFEGVYKPPPPPPETEAAPVSSRLWSLAKSAASVTASAAATAAAKAKAADEKYELSARAKAKAAELGKSAGSFAGRKASEAGTAVARRVGAMTPEERQQWLEGATSVVAVAAAFGGTKTTRALAGVGAVAVNLGSKANNVATSLPTDRAAQYADYLVEEQPGGGGGGGAYSSSEVAEVLTLEVVAAVPGGQTMKVSVEGIGAYEVAVPQGVNVGETFSFEIDAPLSREELEPEAVPMGLPATPEPLNVVPTAVPVGQVGGGGAPAIAPMPVPVVGGPVAMMPTMHQPPPHQQVQPQQQPQSLIQQARGNIEDAREAAAAAGTLARELDKMGVTPQQALNTGAQGVKLAKEMKDAGAGVEWVGRRGKVVWWRVVSTGSARR